MEQLHEKDLIKIKELLRHTGEFIAYFELVESKMITWRQDIELQAQTQEQKTTRQLQSLHNDLEALQEVLTQAGIARLRLRCEEALQQGETHLATLQKTGQQLLAEMSSHQNEFREIMSTNMMILERHTELAINKINSQLATHDVDLFRRIANESCEKVEQVSSNAMQKSSGLLRNFQWRSMALAFFTTVVATLMLGMYISNEMPWEIHQQAKNEREAGRTLLKAWPLLSQQEQNKILHTHPHNIQ